MDGFLGEVIARMTVQEETDIYNNVLHLLSLKHNNQYLFDSIHWQLNALFWENDYKKRNFKYWSSYIYNKEVEKLIDFWINNMKHGIFLYIYPFVNLMLSILKNENVQLRCGAGIEEYCIQTNGMIVPCPVMSGMKDYYIGSIYHSDPLNLKKVYVKNICPDCEVYNLCGGRCLYSNITMKWGIDGFRDVCNTTKYLIDKLISKKEEVQNLIDRNIININQFKKDIKYNSCEIIP